MAADTKPELLSCEEARVFCLSAQDYLSELTEAFDVIFLDPPYDMQLADRTLSLLAERDMIGEGGVIAVEHHVRELLSDSYGKLIMSDQRMYGKTGLSFFVERNPAL